VSLGGGDGGGSGGGGGGDGGNRSGGGVFYSAFYADCTHELKPITDGLRQGLTLGRFFQLNLSAVRGTRGV